MFKLFNEVYFKLIFNQIMNNDPPLLKPCSLGFRPLPPPRKETLRANTLEVNFESETIWILGMPPIPPPPLPLYRGRFSLNLLQPPFLYESIIGALKRNGYLSTKVISPVREEPFQQKRNTMSLLYFLFESFEQIHPFRDKRQKDLSICRSQGGTRQ